MCCTQLGITEGNTPNMNLLGDECVFARAIQKKLVKKGFCDMKLLLYFYLNGTEKLLLGVKLLLIFT